MLKYALKTYSKNFIPVQGTAEMLPFKNNTCDNIVTFFTYRNFSDKSRAINELIRVLKPGGRLILMDAFMPDSKFLQFVHTVWLGKIIPALSIILGKYREYKYLYNSIKMNKSEELENIMKNMLPFGTPVIKKLMSGYITIIIFDKI